MRKLSKSIEAYEAGGGWSSKLFAEQALPLLKGLQAGGVPLQVGRHVIYVGSGDNLIKVYVHHNGRSEEYVTFTDRRGAELATFHYTQFDQLKAFVWARIQGEQE